MIHEIRMAAKDMARLELHGNIGDPLPNLMSAKSVAWINSNIAAFQYMVSIERIIQRCAKLKTRSNKHD